jgi:phage terminase large subunit-like protein
MNQWTASEDRLVDPDDLAACVVLDGPLPPQRGKTYRIGLDIGVRHDRTVAAVCHGELVGDPGRPVGVRVVVDRLQVWAGQGREREVQLDEVAEWLAWASSSYGRAQVIFDPSQAILLAQQLRKRGVRMAEFTFHPRSVSQLALTLHGLIRSRRLALPDDGDLLDELGSVRLRETSPGTYRVDHDADKHDDRAIALALAAYRIVERGTPSAARSYVSRGRLPIRTGVALAGRGVHDSDLRELAASLGLPFTEGSP